MVTIEIPFGLILKRKIFWFDSNINPANCLFSYYKQSSFSGDVWGFNKIPVYTKKIDLRQDLTAISAAFDKGTAYEIRRAEKDNLEFAIETDVDYFINFYNDFAATKSLKPIGNTVKHYCEHLLITKCLQDKDILVMHAYVVDPQTQCARLLYSASQFRLKDPSQKAVIGRGNRYLHFKDMAFLKESGYANYDLGGYAYETTDPVLKGINQFKDGFGGVLVQEFDYWPAWMEALNKWKRFLKKPDAK